MSDLASTLDSAFEGERESSVGETPAPAEAGGEQASPEEAPEGGTQAAPESADEPTGDVLLDRLTPDQIAELKKDPRLKAIYKGLMGSYTPKMQALAEQQKLWDALNNEGTRRQAVESLARAVGLEIKPTDQPQRDQAAVVADGISDEWAKVVGPEAAAALRPLIEKTALAAVQGTLKPIEAATEYLQMDARGRQAQAQVSEFRAEAQKLGWNITPDVERKMAELGQQVLPGRPIESVEDGVKHLKNLYRLATADQAEADAEKRILERMQKAAQTAEPTRSVSSAGRAKRSNVDNAKSLNEAFDIATEEVRSEFGL